MAKLTKEKINDLWRSGYCRKTVEYARKHTDNSTAGAQQRIKYLSSHIAHCQDCYFANVMKNAEAQVASWMGLEAEIAFQYGEDITKRPEYDLDLLRQALRGLMIDGHITPQFMRWMERVAKRKEFK